MNGIINAFTAWSKQFYSDMIHTAQAPNISNIHFSMDFDAQNTHFSIENLAVKIHFSIISLRNARLPQLLFTYFCQNGVNLLQSIKFKWLFCYLGE